MSDAIGIGILAECRDDVGAKPIAPGPEIGGNTPAKSRDLAKD
jgi:hypothetical protein